MRRALLLFAIVLGLAAIAASISRPRDESATRRGEPPAFTPPAARERPPTLTPGPETPSKPALELEFDAAADQSRRLSAGQPATLLVAVDEPGQVEIPLLGLTASADPLTPARFEVLTSEARRYPITFTPADGAEERSAGTLVVAAVERG